MDISPLSGESHSDRNFDEVEAADESNESNDPVAIIKAVVNGDDFFACLQAIPTGRNAKHVQQIHQSPELIGKSAR